ncbi:MAG: hypothetical protein WAX69_19410 [Victivallales bacterium]
MMGSKSILIGAITSLAAILLADVVMAQAGTPATIATELWHETFHLQAPSVQRTRGFGVVETDLRGYQSGAKSVWVHTFRCENAEKSKVLIGKFLADLSLSPKVEIIRIVSGGEEIPAVTTSGGAVFIGCVSGSQGRIISAVSQAAVKDFLKSHGTLAQGAVDKAAYPAFLDRFDRFGWGFYGLGGYNDFHGWMESAAKFDGKKEVKNPVEDLEFAVKHQLRFEPWLDPAKLDNSDGIIMNTEADWLIKKSKEMGLPVSCRVYGESGDADWSARRFPEYMDQPAPFMISGWLLPELHWKTKPHFTWYDKDIHRYMAVKTMDLIKTYVDQPHIMGWMHPHGELVHNPWYDMHDDYSTAAKNSWHEYLLKNGYDLDGVSRLYQRTDRPFGNIDEIPIPEFATFAGIDGQVRSLEGKWWMRQENKSEPAPDKEWWSKPAENKYMGIREKWFQGAVDGKLWTLVAMPGGEEFYNYRYGLTAYTPTTWFRRNFDMSQAQLAKTPIYLYWFPISFGGIHSGENKRFHEVYINGEKAGGIGTWGALDVTALLRPGENQIALHLYGNRWDGRIFLSTDKPSVYPYLGKERNQLCILWNEWHRQVKFEAWREILDGMRQVDTDRPIKFMAPLGHGEDRWLKLASKYGGFGQFTGEGTWFFPWYKRYGYLYGLPATSETGGPANNLSGQFDTYRRTFLAGLNGHDAVFIAQSYTRNPELRKFWEDHDPVLKQMGRYDMYGPQVLLYRSSKMTLGYGGWKPYPELGQSTREIQNPWDWDIGRGTLQTLGQSYCYLDDGGVSDGKMGGYPVMLDCGNETMPPQTIDKIEEWVKSGGTFVTYPFTGRNSLLEPDAWPIRKLTGCEVAKLRKPGTGSVTIGKDQNVFKALSGKTFPDNGTSMDYIGNEHNLISTELKPGADCEILATFDNGAPAIVRRKLGKGAVIALGSVFWRGSQDRMGIWWPEPLETNFIADLLNGLGFPTAFCVTDDRLVWPQPYRSNNGLDLVAVLVSWHDDKDVDTTVKIRLPTKPAALVCFGVGGIKDLPFDWIDGQAVAKVNMPAKEVKVIRATGCADPFDAVNHWWNYQQKIWHELAKSTIDFAPYRKGKWADPTLDLRVGAKLSNDKPQSDAWMKSGFDDKTWKSCTLTVLDFVGANPGAPLWIRNSFIVPAEWAAEGGKIFLINGAWVGKQYIGEARLSFNGTMLSDFSQPEYQEFDVTKLLNEGENVIAYEFKGGTVPQGFLGQVYLYHEKPAASSLLLGGRWDGVTADGKPAAITFPGKGTIKWPTRKVLIPKEWEGNYQVRLRIEGEKSSVLGAWVNGKMIRRFHHGLGGKCDIDITNALRFGRENEIVLPYHHEQSGADLSEKAFDWNIQAIRLDAYK